MKRCIPILLLLCLLLTGCGSYETEDGLLVDPHAQTITHGQDVYHYQLQGLKGITTCRITCPDGSVYHWTQVAGTTYSGGDDGYTEGKYLPGDVLVKALDRQIRNTRHTGWLIVGLALMACGAYDLAAPHSVWDITRSWMVTNGTPSKAALQHIKIQGALLIAAGLWLCFM